MAEEHGCEAPEGHRLCANNCGFFGSPATQNYCPKCYRDIFLKEEQGKSKSANSVDSVLSAPASSPSPIYAAERATAAVAAERATAAVAAERATAEVQRSASRCSACRKKVGLTGFRCRCGVTFCGAHRYPEMHGCTFDFKAVGREAIAKANPLIKAQKLEKI